MIYRELQHVVYEYLSGQKEAQVFPPVPMVYEHVPAEPLDWEYRVLSINLREHGMPTAAELNELGGQGWLLVGVLNADQHFVHYYFVRQKRA